MHRELATTILPRLPLHDTLRDWPAIARDLAEPKRRRLRAQLI